jgi:hypothetical protein
MEIATDKCGNIKEQPSQIWSYVLVKRDLYLKKEHKSIIQGGSMVTGGVCSMYLQHYIRVISLIQKGRDYSKEVQRHSDRGRNSNESSSKGRSPKMRMALCH